MSVHRAWRPPVTARGACSGMQCRHCACVPTRDRSTSAAVDIAAQRAGDDLLPDRAQFRQACLRVRGDSRRRLTEVRIRTASIAMAPGLRQAADDVVMTRGASPAMTMSTRALAASVGGVRGGRWRPGMPPGGAAPRPVRRCRGRTARRSPRPRAPGTSVPTSAPRARGSHGVSARPGSP
jgi:hypothetical protein